MVKNLFHRFTDGQDGFFHWGCHALLERLSQITPALHCFGHVHDEVGAKMLSFDGVEVGIWRLHIQMKTHQFFSIGDGFFRLFFRIPGRVTSQLRKEEGRGTVCSFFCQLLLVLSLRSGNLLKHQDLGHLFWSEKNRWN